jgi:hypothetical protein
MEYPPIHVKSQNTFRLPSNKSWISNFELIFHPIVIGFFKWSSVLFIEWQKGDQKGVQISKFPKKTNHLYGLMMDNKNIKEINHGRRNRNSNMTSFFRFVNKRASYPFGIISLAHAPVNVTDFSIGSINCVQHNSSTCTFMTSVVLMEHP